MRNPNLDLLSKADGTPEVSILQTIEGNWINELMNCYFSLCKYLISFLITWLASLSKFLCSHNFPCALSLGVFWTEIFSKLKLQVLSYLGNQSRLIFGCRLIRNSWRSYCYQMSYRSSLEWLCGDISAMPLCIDIPEEMKKSAILGLALGTH